jgi:tyrosine-specific transport protein
VLPIAFTSFAYQGIIPTLVNYLHEDVKKIRRAIIIGSSIPLFAYVIWQWLILGIIPTHGPGGLAGALAKGDNAVYPLKNFIQHSAVFYIGQSFAFFALITSCLGVTLGLRDFLADGLKIQKDTKGKILLTILIFAIPLFIAVLYPHIFLLSLDYAGGFGCALLLGLLPILMVWVGRYRLGHDQNPQVKGGKVVLALLFIFVVFEIAYELRNFF